MIKIMMHRPFHNHQFLHGSMKPIQFQVLSVASVSEHSFTYCLNRVEYEWLFQKLSYGVLTLKLYFFFFLLTTFNKRLVYKMFNPQNGRSKKKAKI